MVSKNSCKKPLIVSDGNSLFPETESLTSGITKCAVCGSAVDIERSATDTYGSDRIC
jgi:hypothetical protein